MEKSKKKASDKANQVKKNLTYSTTVTARCGHRVVVQGTHFGRARRAASKVAANRCERCQSDG